MTKSKTDTLDLGLSIGNYWIDLVHINKMANEYLWNSYVVECIYRTCYRPAYCQVPVHCKYVSCISDHGARMAHNALGRWTVMDPLMEKYYPVSPYVYCGNNPVSFVDSNGRKIFFAPGVSSAFRNDFKMAVRHLNQHGASGMLAQLEKSDKIYYIDESSDIKSKFDPNNNTISWASRVGISTTEGVILSPTTVLNHEVDHALQHDQNPEQQRADGMQKSSNDNAYGDKEEERVVTGSEQQTAKKLGEIKEGEVTRKDHYGTPFKMKSAISTEIDPEHEIRITPKDPKK